MNPEFIHRHYVISPSVAVYGALPPEILTPEIQSQASACNAFLSRAAFHGAELHQPMVFYSEITLFAFQLQQQGFFDLPDCKALAQSVLSTSWEWHFPTTDDILDCLFETQNLFDSEYLALAKQLGCPFICTNPDVKTKHSLIMPVQYHAWSSSGTLDAFPPTES